MFDPFTLALIGGAIGGLTNKKNPLEGALLGAGGGYLGGAALGGGGLLSSAPAAALPGANTAAELAAAQTSLEPAAYGLLEQPSVMSQATGLLKPVGQAMNAASTAKSLMPQDKPIVPAQMPTPMPNSTLGNMVQGMEQQQINQMAQDEQMRLARRKARGQYGFA